MEMKRDRSMSAQCVDDVNRRHAFTSHSNVSNSKNSSVHPSFCINNYNNNTNYMMIHLK